MNPLRLFRHHGHKHQDHKLPDQIFDNLKKAALSEYKSVLKIYKTKASGLEKNEVNKRLKKYGLNETLGQRPKPMWLKLILAFKDPLIILLIILAAISLTTGSISSVIMILSMVFLSVFIKFYQEAKAQNAASSLEKIVKISTLVLREREEKKVALKKIVPGDIILLSAGDMVPADLRLIECQGLLVDQSMFTGESLPVEKNILTEKDNKKSPLYFDNLCFMGTSIDSGFAKGVVIATGPNSYFGSMVKNILAERELTNFDLWLKSFTQLIMRLVIVMVLLVFVINFLTKGDIWQAFLFSLAVTVGLAPEMLPMIVSANLASGALRLSKKKVIVKHLSSIQNFGSMDVLCTDKTGTLTLNQIILEKHCDINHQDSAQVLKQAYINSYLQSGFKNILDQAILNHGNIALTHTKKLGEIPFDFQRKMLSVIYQQNDKKILVVKGAAEKIFERCDYYELNGQTHKVNKEIFPHLQKEFAKLSWDGFRVLGLAYKNINTKEKYSPADEKNLTFLGYLAFLDPPKPSAQETIEKLHSLGIDIKILTGDNQLITQKVCQEVSFKIKGLVTGDQIEKADAKTLSSLVEKNNIFTQLSPMHKEKIITALRHNRHVVGYLGDGINDAPALRAGDVGISVDSGANIAKESSDIILLEKNLMVLADGVMEGRRIFVNIIKYIRMATSSNFGNMASVIGTSIFLPFLPMLPIQILLNNLLYDLSQSTIPTDQVDSEQLKKITAWDIKKVKKYILSFGIVSSIFDYATFFMLLWAFNAWYNPALFQTGWFIESLLSQTLIIHVIRTNKIPFIQSRASWPLIISTIGISLIGLYLPFSPLASNLGFVAPPASYFIGLGTIIILYLASTQLLKNYLQKKSFI